MRRPRRNTSPLMNMNFALGFSGGALALINEATIPGRDIVISNTSAGTRKSIFPDVADRAPNTVDQVTRANLPIIGVMNGATNLVDTDLSNGVSWVSGGVGSVTVTEPSTGVYRVTFNGDGGVVLKAAITNSALDRISLCEARLISGSFGAGATNYFSFRATSDTQKGTAYSLEDVVEDWGDVTASVTSSDTTGQLVFRSDNASVSVIEIRNMRAVDSAVAHAGFPDGSAPAATYATDIPTCTPSFGSAGTIVQVAIPYGYSGADNPVNSSARLFETNNLLCLTPGSVTVQGSGGSPAIDTSGSVVDGQVSVVSSDWDGVEIGARYGASYSRTTALESDTPSGLMRIGNTSFPRPFHGGILTLIFSRVLSDTEYEALRIYLNTVFGGLIFD